MFSFFIFRSVCSVGKDILLQTPYKQFLDEYGVKPDVEILPTLKDRTKKVDKALNWILEDIN